LIFTISYFSLIEHIVKRLRKKFHDFIIFLYFIGIEQDIAQISIFWKRNKPRNTFFTKPLRATETDSGALGPMLSTAMLTTVTVALTGAFSLPVRSPVTGLAPT
jgi:hypothetical protein